MFSIGTLVCVPLVVTGILLNLHRIDLFRAGGHSISLGLCPTKLPVKWDIQLGQLDVPATIFKFP